MFARRLLSRIVWAHSAAAKPPVALEGYIAQRGTVLTLATASGQAGRELSLSGADAGATVLVTPATAQFKVGAATFAAAPSLALVVHLGLAPTPIDLAAARAAGVAVHTSLSPKAPTAAAAVADSAVHLALALLQSFGGARQLEGERVALIGLGGGSVGAAVAERLAALGAEFLSYTNAPRLPADAEEALGLSAHPSPCDAAEGATLLVCCGGASPADTAEVLRACHRGAIVIDATPDGSALAPAAVAAAVAAGQVAGYGRVAVGEFPAELRGVAAVAAAHVAPDAWLEAEAGEKAVAIIDAAIKGKPLTEGVVLKGTRPLPTPFATVPPRPPPRAAPAHTHGGGHGHGHGGGHAHGGGHGGSHGGGHGHAKAH